MDLRSKLDRRKALKWGLLSAAAPAVSRPDSREIGTPVEPGHVYLAPDDRHLCMVDGHVSLSSAPPVGGSPAARCPCRCRPARRRDGTGWATAPPTRIPTAASG